MPITITIPVHIAREDLADPAARVCLLDNLAHLSENSIKSLYVLVFDLLSLGDPTPSAKDLKRMLEQRPEWVDHPNDTGDTPLMQAIMNSHLELVDVLLDAGAQTDFKNNAGLDILGVIACFNRDHPLQDALVTKLLGTGTFSSKEKDTALYYAACYSNPGMARTLLAHGAGLGVVVGEDVSILSVAAAALESRHPSAEVVHALLQHPDVKPLLNKGWDLATPKTPLHHASVNGSHRMISLLLDAGASPNPPENLQSGTRETPLMWAARGLHPEAIARLLESANPTALDSMGCNALHHLASYTSWRKPDIEHPLVFRALGLLLAAGTDPFQKDADGRTPLDLARLRNDAPMINAFEAVSSSHLMRTETPFPTVSRKTSSPRL